LRLNIKSLQAGLPRQAPLITYQRCRTRFRTACCAKCSKSRLRFGLVTWPLNSSPNNKTPENQHNQSDADLLRRRPVACGPGQSTTDWEHWTRPRIEPRRTSGRRAGAAIGPLLVFKFCGPNYSPDKWDCSLAAGRWRPDALSRLVSVTYPGSANRGSQARGEKAPSSL